MVEKVVLVTGGSNGIGASICKELAKVGYFVYINCKSNINSAKEILNEIISMGGQGKILKFDVSDVAQIQEALKEIEHEKLDLLINNAGVSNENLLYQIELTDWNNVININFWGAVNTLSQIRNKLANSENATVINIGSISGVRPRKGQGVYSISKSMLIEWSKEEAKLDVNKDIKFYVISPGPVATNMIKASKFYKSSDISKRVPLGRFADPEEIAEEVVFLAENRGLIKSGSNIILDGGLTQASID
jgi:3-oxoacyl-[acyl-carrier protein] reductase